MRGSLQQLGMRIFPLTRIASQSDLSPQAGRGEAARGSFARSNSALYSRGRFLPELCQITIPPRQRAQGMPGASTAPTACVKRKHASSRRRFAENVPAFPARMVLTVSFVLAPETGLSCLRRQPQCEKHCRQLDISVGISGPHDFAVRERLLSSDATRASTASRSQRP